MMKPIWRIGGAVMVWKLLAVFVCGFAIPASAASSNGGEYNFTINVALSPKASAELAARNERIFVEARYQGEPLPGREKYVMKDGPELIWLGSERANIPGVSASVIFSGKNVKRSRINWVKQFNAQISIWTARLSGPSNLLDCGYFEESVIVLHKTPTTISCRLIGEPKLIGEP